VYYLGLPEFQKERCLQSVFSRSKDMSLTQVKRKIACHILRIEDLPSILKFISIFGICSVVGIRRRLHSLLERVQTSNDIVTSRVSVQLLDVLNIVDVESNTELDPQPKNYKFAFNGNGYKGIYFIFMPQLSSLRISVQYRCLLVKDALSKLNSLGISTANVPQQQGDRMTDEERD
jgi:hypothetical protein